MNSKIKKKWVEALRSGEYAQGRDKLREDNTYCCLGVLCDLHRKAMKKGENKWEDYKEHDFLPTRVSEWAGLDEAEEVDWGNGLDVKVKGKYLSEYNDEGVSFLRIADMIEKEL